MAKLMNAAPDSPEALQEELSLPERAAEIFGDPERRRNWLDSYVTATNKRDPDLQAQLTEGQERGFKAFLETNGIDIEALKSGASGGSVKRLPMSLDGVPDDAKGGPDIYKHLNLTRPERRQIAATGRGPGMEVAGQFENLGEFLTQGWHSTISRNGFDKRLKALMGESSGDAGGFLVPEEFRAELLRVALETALVRPRARVVPMGGLTVRYPAIRDASHASGVYGGISASWTPEAGDTSSTTNEPTFAQIALTAKKLTAYTVAANELLADSAISLEAVLMQLFAEAVAYFEDDAFIAGSGAGQPLGILNADALISVAKETGQEATTIRWENLVKMFSRMLPGSLARGVWYAHVDTFPSLALMSLSVGTGGSAVWINNGVAGPPATILGRPVFFTEKAETLGAAGDIVFADFNYYLIGDRQAMSVSNSPHVRFTTDQTVWRFIQRVDGRPWVDTALTPRNGTNTLSPFVSLAARA